MSDGKSLLELVVVTVAALGFVSLLLVIQGGQNGRTRAEIARALIAVWAAVAGMLAAVVGVRAVLGEVFEVQIGSGTPIVWRSLGPAQIAALVGLVVVTIVLYVIAYGAARRLLRPAPGLEVRPQDHDEEDDR